MSRLRDQPLRGIILSLLITYLTINSATGDDCKVTTKSGPLQGSLSEVLGKKICVFSGIPFAQPPIGDLRLKKTTPVEPWTEVLMADKAKPFCPQIKKDLKSELDFDLTKELDGKELVGGPLAMTLEMQDFAMSEDCLYLNVYTPANLSPEKKYAMIIFFHPGMFYNGGATMSSIDPSILVAENDVVVAIPQYRLGLLGYLYCGVPESPGNVGLWDQRQVR